ncbi:hypothetical protein ACET3X_007740 [Alternaria dauci]|uniref:Hydrophobin n=1 Tax=Alternaria dauci TaxID=48095 RepID=A0ABR3UDB2_9PLEO
MQFTIAAVLAFAATSAFAAPLDERQVGICASGNPVCCATDVLNLANLDCAPPPLTTTVADFVDTCAAAGQQAKCCLLPVLGQGLICSDVTV